MFGGHFFLFQVKKPKRLRVLKKGKDATRDARKGPGENVFHVVASSKSQREMKAPRFLLFNFKILPSQFTSFLVLLLLLLVAPQLQS